MEAWQRYLRNSAKRPYRADRSDDVRGLSCVVVPQKNAAKKAFRRG